MFAFQRAGSFDSLQRAVEGDSLPSETSSNRAPTTSVNNAHSPGHESGPIPPLELDHQIAVQLAKTRGSTESFRLAVDRTHDDPKTYDDPSASDLMTVGVFLWIRFLCLQTTQG